ncbi:hypothetical protein IEQ34_021590 [Dendrobium chrysotoxum]|uniref:Uncharacterized protein n=1 Tax=Dendrobium chrysotoxum TaxID=161865 RepID=A0AAV7G573_DENCH|nr:hypothetical protein IEQ34_021590 [Dendrobium chrysotoxum]
MAASSVVSLRHATLRLETPMERWSRLEMGCIRGFRVLGTSCEEERYRSRESMPLETVRERRDGRTSRNYLVRDRTVLCAVSLCLGFNGIIFCIDDVNSSFHLSISSELRCALHELSMCFDRSMKAQLKRSKGAMAPYSHPVTSVVTDDAIFTSSNIVITRADIDQLVTNDYLDNEHPTNLFVQHINDNSVKESNLLILPIIYNKQWTLLVDK